MYLLNRPNCSIWCVNTPRSIRLCHLDRRTPCGLFPPPRLQALSLTTKLRVLCVTFHLTVCIFWRRLKLSAHWECLKKEQLNNSVLWYNWFAFLIRPTLREHLSSDSVGHMCRRVCISSFLNSRGLRTPNILSLWSYIIQHSTTLIV